MVLLYAMGRSVYYENVGKQNEIDETTEQIEAEVTDVDVVQKMETERYRRNKRIYNKYPGTQSWFYKKALHLHKVPEPYYTFFLQSIFPQYGACIPDQGF